MFCDLPKGRSITKLLRLSHFASKYKGPSSIDHKERGSHARGASNTGYLAYENSKGDTRGRHRYQTNSKGVVRNMKERYVGTKGNSPKQGLTSAKDLTVQLPEGRESPTMD